MTGASRMTMKEKPGESATMAVGSATSPALLIPAIQAVASREAKTTASVFIAIVIWSGIFCNRHSFSLFRDRRSLSLFRGSYSDPKTVTHRQSYDVVDPLPESFVIPASGLANLKYTEPTVIFRRRPTLDNQVVVVDVLSIGSKTRPEYLTAQINTWASHVNVQNFWGFTEQDDYNPNCADTLSDEALESFVESCRSNRLWHTDRGGQDKFQNMRKFQHMRKTQFGVASGKTIDERHSGWFCAQRRPGRALGWLQVMYQNPTVIPDILLIVDDDTSVDIEKMKQLMHKSRDNAIPFVGAPCTYRRGEISFAFGGFGTFLNRASIERMAGPIFCDDERQQESPYMDLVCANLQQNRVGELELFREGDSVFDIFYKYSALNKFCMHSDWALGYMISLYSGGSLNQIGNQLSPNQCPLDPCTLESVVCHNQGPNDMIEFTLSHNSGNEIM